ncbi:MAG: hypothetical protein KatS3mg057_2766 [Herpetosiphonaceae bacterium]|nr:MAG: hypothetical protein KatS3mg057_2766 [Herpetosiphonaceae bacterium]
MEVRYHLCGYPLKVQSQADRDSVEMLFFDGTADEQGLEIFFCPGCGKQLEEDTICDEAPNPGMVLAGWLKAWPELRRQLQAQIIRLARHDRKFYPYYAGYELQEFEDELYTMTDLATELAGGARYQVEQGDGR